MFLRRLHLQDFKCHADLEIGFGTDKKENRKWTLILGENGTGKSNVLKAIALITAGSNGLGELLGDADQWIRVDQNECRISATLVTKEGEERFISLTFKRGDNLSNIISFNQKSLELIDNAIEKSVRNYFVVGYGASRRLSNYPFAGERKNSSQRASNVRNLFDNNVALNPLTSWAIDLDYRNAQSGLAIVEDTLNDFLPDTYFARIDRERKQLIFATADGDIPLDQLSDGYQNMAAWIGDLLFRITSNFKDYEKPLSARGLLLIDEIDLHLHPKWQRNLIDFIERKLPNFQVVASTHSPLTAQQAGEGELYALRRTASKAVEIIPFIGSPKTLLINQLLMTPVFGLETDESVEVEKLKAEYRDLSDREQDLNAAEKKQFKAIKAKVAKDLPRRPSALISNAELDLLDQIKSKLKV